VLIVQSGTAPPGRATSSSIADLLRQHGASEDLPNLDQIRLARPSAHYSVALLQRDTNDWNQFSLFELIAVQYNFLARSPAGEVLAAYQMPQVVQPLPFPDFARLRIRQPAHDLKTWRERTLDLSSALNATNCAADVRLEWGDVLEIPEADHRLGMYWAGFPSAEFAALRKCLARQVEIIVKGQPTNIFLAPDSAYVNHLGMAPQTELNNAAFWIKPVLRNSNLLLSSSDLSRVKVTRHDPATGKAREWVLDCSESKPTPAFWLRDGDVIEVPEKP